MRLRLCGSNRQKSDNSHVALRAVLHEYFIQIRRNTTKDNAIGPDVVQSLPNILVQGPDKSGCTSHGDTPDIGSEGSQPAVDGFVAAVNLADIVNNTGSLCRQGSDEQRHPGSDVR